MAEPPKYEPFDPKDHLPGAQWPGTPPDPDPNAPRGADETPKSTMSPRDAPRGPTLKVTGMHPGGLWGRGGGPKPAPRKSRYSDKGPATFDRFVGIAGALVSIVYSTLQANGVTMNWLFSAIIYLLCIAGILVSLIRHAIPHLGLVWRWVLGSAGVLFFGWLGGVGTLKQYRVEHPNKPDIDLTIDSMIASFPISSEVDHQRFQVFVIIFNRGSPAKLHGWNLDLKSDAVVFSAHQVFNQEPIGGRMKFPAVDELSSKPLDHGEQVTRCAYFVIQGLTQGRLDAMKGDPSAVLIISVLDEGETKYIAKKSVMELINQGVEHFKSP